MTRLREQSGFTVVEILVATLITLIVFGCVMAALENFQRDASLDQTRNEVQDKARTMIDALSRDLRNVASPTAGSAGALEKAGTLDLVFETVDTVDNITWGQNATHQERVRYCLDTSNPGNETLYRETQTWTTATAPAMPDTSTCPGTAWGASPTKAVTNVTNYSGKSKPLFTPLPPNATSTAQINGINVDLFLQSSPSVKETELTSGIYLRNGLEPPTAGFTASQVNGSVYLNGSASNDPNGQSLSYQWSVDGTATSGATTQQYQYPPNTFASGSTHTFALTVTDTAGLANTISQTVKIN